MSRIHLSSSSKTLSSHAGLTLIGDCLPLAHVDALDGRFPTRRGMRTSDLIKCYVGLLCLGQSDFEAITNHRADPAFRKLLKAVQAPISQELGAAAGHVCLDLERLPSGKFAVNDLVLRLAMLAYNCLRLLGQLGMVGAVIKPRIQV